MHFLTLFLHHFHLQLLFSFFSHPFFILIFFYIYFSHTCRRPTMSTKYNAKTWQYGRRQVFLYIFYYLSPLTHSQILRVSRSSSSPHFCLSLSSFVCLFSVCAACAVSFPSLLLPFIPSFLCFLLP